MNKVNYLCTYLICNSHKSIIHHFKYTKSFSDITTGSTPVDSKVPSAAPIPAAIFVQLELNIFHTLHTSYDKAKIIATKKVKCSHLF